MAIRSALRDLLGIPGGRRLVAAALVRSTTSGAMRPFLVVYALGIGLDPVPAGTSLTVGMLAGLLAVPLAGLWIDAGARRGPAAVPLLVQAAAMIALVAAPTAGGFLAAALLAGIGTQSTNPGMKALLATVVPGEHLATALALNRTLLNAGLGVGATAGVAAVAAGPQALPVLALGAAAGAVVAAGLTAAVPVRVSTPPRTTDAPPPRTPPGRGIVLLALAGIPFAFSADVLEIALPIVLTRGDAGDPALPGVAFVINTALVLLLQVPIVVAARGIANRVLFAASGLVLAAAYLGFWAAGDATTLVLLLIVPYTLGEILYTGSAEPLVIESLPRDRLGRGLSVWYTAYGLARALDPLVITVLLALGPAVFWPTLAAATVAGAVVVLATGISRRRSRASTGPTRPVRLRRP